jgi:hypothetical protein
MFRAVPFSSSGSQIVLLQHLVSSLCHSVHRLTADCSPLSTGALHSCLRRVTIPDAVTIQFDLLKMSMVLLETCRGLKCNIYYFNSHCYTPTQRMLNKIMYTFLVTPCMLHVCRASLFNDTVNICNLVSFPLLTGHF